MENQRGNSRNALLNSVFSVRHWDLPDLQGMKASNGVTFNGI
jgi:hypothetical protein